MPLPEPYLWLIAGMVLVALEVLTAPGIGLVFGGLAAIIVGVVIETGAIDQANHAAQFACWFALTCLTGFLLWKPMKNWRMKSRHSGDYNNMAGGTATVCDGDLVRGKTGKAKWSGTVMNAEIDSSSSVDKIENGQLAEIVSVEGITLKLRPKH